MGLSESPEGKVEQMCVEFLGETIDRKPTCESLCL